MTDLLQPDQLLAQTQSFMERLKALHRVTIQMTQAETFDDLCRLAIELGRRELGFDRLGLWFVDQEDPRFVVGSFGTDEMGDIRDERHQRLPSIEFDFPILSINENTRMYYNPNRELYNDKREFVGMGWVALAYLNDGEKILGSLSTDNYFSRRPLHQYDLELLALYAAALGHLCTRKRMESVVLERERLQTVLEQEQKHQEHLEQLVAERTFQLEREKQYFESLLVNSPVAIVVINMDNAIMSWNPAAEKLFGYTQVEAIGRTVDEIIAPEGLLPEAIAYSKQTLNEDKLVHAITQRKRKDGTLFDVEVWGVPVIVEGTLSGALAIYHDITELQRARNEAESANRAKSAFLATMSHEIRTPMNGVIGMTSLLLDTLLTDEQRDYAETIRHSADALLTIINDILDFSKIEADRLELETQPFDVHRCVETALDLLVSRAREKQLELIYLIDPQVPVSLIGDVTRLRQIILNLLSNAIKFTDTGEILISLKGERQANTNLYTLHFSVRDTGIGIPTSRMEHLFQSFSQADASTTRKYGGTGLGLVISKRLSELMGGTMWAESEEGKGSTFYFTIQAEAAPAQARVYLSAEQPQLRDRHVLIVDDNATNRRVLVAQTRAWNMLPRDTGSPHQALEWIKRGDPFDLALLDMQMPEMDGITLASEMRLLRDAKQLPIVMLSSVDRQASTTEPVTLSAYLTKPIKQSLLYETMLEVFVGQPAAIRVSTLPEEPLFDRQLAERLPLRILVAEDNAINQKLAIQMLRKMGYRADVAGNGIEVLEAVARQVYDVVLMDVQMPEMDGFETTRHLHEKYANKRPRIIAMTANAMQGDREACLAAGMDDYISKPVQVRDLQFALERWGQTDASVSRATFKSTKRGEHPIIDWAALDRIRALQEEGEPDFVQEMVAIYLSETPDTIKTIREAVAQKNAETLRFWAHTLKANSNSLGAVRLGEVCLKLERIGREGTVEGAEALLDSLEREFEQARQRLESGPI